MLDCEAKVQHVERNSFRSFFSFFRLGQGAQKNGMNSVLHGVIIARRSGFLKTAFPRKRVTSLLLVMYNAGIQKDPERSP
jgi:hypothetical protein